MKLTLETVKSIVPHPDRDVAVWDDTLSGFGIRVKPSGVKSAILNVTESHSQRSRGVQKR